MFFFVIFVSWFVCFLTCSSVYFVLFVFWFKFLVSLFYSCLFCFDEFVTFACLFFLLLLLYFCLNATFVAWFRVFCFFFCFLFCWLVGWFLCLYGFVHFCDVRSVRLFSLYCTIAFLLVCLACPACFQFLFGLFVYLPICYLGVRLLACSSIDYSFVCFIKL